MKDDFWRLPATTLSRLLDRRECSPVDLVRTVLDRVERLQPRLNCFITACPEQALAKAREAESRQMRGARLGPLDGIPYTCKDIVNTAGVRTTFGSLLRADHVPDEDAVAVARLHAAGAILIGKTTTSEFGAKCLTDAPLFGRTANAWHRDRTSGGSSGGAAVAVAAGLAPIAVATDGGGSTRIPAACNGVVGIKQSIGLIPHSQVEDAFGNMTYVTPMTRTVGDTALMLQAMAGPDASDPWSIGLPVPDFLAVAGQKPAEACALIGRAPSDPSRPLRVGWMLAPAGKPVARDTAVAVQAVLDRLAGAGAQLLPIDDEGFDCEPLWRAINHTVWLSRFGRMAQTDGARMTPSLLQQLALAQAVSGVDYQQAMFARTRLFRKVQQIFETVDVLLTPTLLRSALPVDQDLFGTIEIDGQVLPDVRPHWFPWTMPFNLTGHPAISLPAGFDADGLPIGVQLVGHFRADADLLRLAAGLEASMGLLSRWPTLE